MARLNGKVVIVTGAGRGLGKAMSKGLIAAGARIVGVDLPGEIELSTTAAELGSGFEPVFADLTIESDCNKVIEAANDKFGRVDVLVNNAGVFRNATPFWDVTLAQWRKVMETNATTQFLMARAVVPQLLAQRWGRILNVTTSFNTMLLPGFVAYGTSKATAEAMTAIMAKDLTGSGVTVNAILPGGPADTRMIAGERFSDRSKLISPEKMVPPVVWLSSNEADGVAGRRFIANDWDEKLPRIAAALASSAKAAW